MSDSIIDPTDYLTISNSYADAWGSIVGSNTYLYAAVNDIVDLDDIYPEVDLLTPFWNSYLLSVDQIEKPSALIDAVRALNTHVLVRGGYTDMNDYFDNNPTAYPVQVNWQYLSEEAGYAISDTYVTP